MAPRLKQDYPALIAEYERRIAAGESLHEVKRDFTARGINFGTFDNQRRAFKKKTPQEPPMIDEPVAVLPGQMEIEDADTPASEQKPGIRTLPLRSIILDAGTQMRVELSPETVSEFAQDMLNGDQFPPVVVFSIDDATFMLADGFHRVQAAKNALHATITAEVHPGGLDEAIDYACQANIKHGLRPTTADKRKAALIQLERHPERADREIARLCGCSPTTIGNYRQSLHERPSVQNGQIDQEPNGQSSVDESPSVQIGQINHEASSHEPTRTVIVHRGESAYPQRVPAQRTTKPKVQKPNGHVAEPAMPHRKRVQDGLVAVLSLVKDDHAWRLLAELRDRLEGYAEQFADPDLQQRIEQALSPLSHLIEDHHQTPTSEDAPATE